MWDFPEVRKLAIEELSNVAMNPVTKVLLARQYTLRQWLFAGYEELARRKETISFSEAEQLGWDTAIRIMHIREQTFCKRRLGRCAESIRTAFAEELVDTEKGVVMDIHGEGTTRRTDDSHATLVERDIN